jgi:hypothetical protein
MIEDMGLKIIASRSLEWHYLCTKFHENLPCSSEVISGGHTDRHTHTDRQTDKQTDYLRSLLLILESREELICLLSLHKSFI